MRPLAIPGLLILTALAVVYTVRAAQRRAQSIGCGNSVVAICFAGRLWAEEHGGQFPTNFICMSNDLSPRILSCIPKHRERISDWSSFTQDACTYEIITPGVL